MIYNFFHTVINEIIDIFFKYVDVDFTLWLSYVLRPILISFLLPSVILVLFYVTAVILHIYKLHRGHLSEVLQTGDFWDKARWLVAAIWDAHGWLWHGYQVQGLHNLPEGSALIVYYHGTLPVDIYYLIARLYLIERRLIHTVADRFLFNIPGWGVISEAIKVIPGTVQTCTNILNRGNLLAISPGGVYEAQFGDPYYRLMWKGRTGFAKVALAAKVPVVPMFTENIREAFRNLPFGRRLFLRLYLRTRLPLVPIFGGFPVRLTTHIGPPIPHDETLSPEDLQAKVASAIESLRDQHQKIPGSILRGLWQRIAISAN